MQYLFCIYFSPHNMFLINTLIQYFFNIGYMNNFFSHKLAFLDSDGRCTPFIEGRMRQDETAAIILPSYKNILVNACKVRYYKPATEPCDYLIKNYYRDADRPISKWLIRPIIVQLEKQN